MQPSITSTQNPRVKLAVSLDKPRARKELGLFIVEGLRELKHALKSSYDVHSVFYNPRLVSEGELMDLISDESLVFSVSDNVFEKLAYRESTSGVVAILKSRQHNLGNLKLPKNPLVLVLESVEKPGNLGAMLRTADAAGVDAVIVCDPLTDFYNPNVVRSSIGAVFTCNLASASGGETISFLKENHIPIFCTHLEASESYVKKDFTAGAAIVMGTESTGLSDLWTAHSDANIIIPMRGTVDSMNVSVSAAIVIFEALRQRSEAGC
jgi:RNA methyltransferase, TrmH family